MYVLSIKVKTQTQISFFFINFILDLIDTREKKMIDYIPFLLSLTRIPHGYRKKNGGYIFIIYGHIQNYSGLLRLFLNFDDRVLGTPHRFLGTHTPMDCMCDSIHDCILHINHLSIPKQGIEKGDLAY